MLHDYHSTAHSLVPNHALRNVRLLQVLHLLLAQLHVDRACTTNQLSPPRPQNQTALTNQIRQILQRRRPHNRRRHPRPVHDPRQRQLRHAAPLLPRQLLDAVHDRVRARLRLAVLPDEPVDLAALRLLGERAREAAAREGRPRDGADAVLLERGEHLALFFAVGEAVVVLHRDEGRELVLDGVALHRVD